MHARGVRNGVTVVVALGASAAALAGWVRAPGERPAPSLRIVEIRPLTTSDAGLRDLITHTFAVRVTITGWRLLPYQPAVTSDDNDRGAGHWRLYLDGHQLADNLGSSPVSYVYLPSGIHWLAAELSNADSTSLRPSVWSEPVIVHVPRVVRCWQTGWHGSPERGTPTFSCRSRQTGIRSRRLHITAGNVSPRL